MYYVLYLASMYTSHPASLNHTRKGLTYITPNPGLCKRRHWPDPLYESQSQPTSPTSQTHDQPSEHGYTCTVRVNNREYQTDTICSSELLARENAAMRAYLICRNFSVNDGMYVQEGEGVQGIPVAIGTGRKQSSSSHRAGRGRDGESTSSSSSSSSGGGGSPGGGSPEHRYAFYPGLKVDGYGYGYGYGYGREM